MQGLMKLRLMSYEEFHAEQTGVHVLEEGLAIGTYYAEWSLEEVVAELVEFTTRVFICAERYEGSELSGIMLRLDLRHHVQVRVGVRVGVWTPRIRELG